MTKDRVSVLVAGSELDLSENLEDILGNESWIDVVGFSNSRKRVLELVKKLAPEVIVMDLDFAGEDLQATQQILDINPDCKIIVLSIYDYVGRVDVQTVSEKTQPALDSIEWLSKNARPSQLLGTISKTSETQKKRRLQ